MGDVVTIAATNSTPSRMTMDGRCRVTDGPISDGALATEPPPPMSAPGSPPGATATSIQYAPNSPPSPSQRLRRAVHPDARPTPVMRAQRDDCTAPLAIESPTFSPQRPLKIAPSPQRCGGTCSLSRLRPLPGHLALECAAAAQSLSPGRPSQNPASSGKTGCLVLPLPPETLAQHPCPSNLRPLVLAPWVMQRCSVSIHSRGRRSSPSPRGEADSGVFGRNR